MANGLERAMAKALVKAAMGKDSERATGKGIGDGSDGEGIGEGYGVGRGSGKGVGYGKGIGEGSGRGTGIGIGRSSTDGGYGEGRGVGIGTGHGGYETEHGPWRGRPGYGHSADSGGISDKVGNSRSCGCHSFLCSGGDVNRYHHSFILPGFRRTTSDSTVCSATSDRNSIYDQNEMQSHPRTPIK
ncbi:keratin-associated protein 21-1-like isoform X3 [Pyrus x bretschneideri]|uniref:keratin-associated protein 21-1-like isoform X3 n=1 Tax=Pyrus x bretschneideri TaxID=225117 RepID=UPI00202EA5C3|nr:keratin-associated protein 21-1-like isoform X3 [Pyrus x bretschneideri]